MSDLKEKIFEIHFQRPRRSELCGMPGQAVPHRILHDEYAQAGNMASLSPNLDHAAKNTYRKCQCHRSQSPDFGHLAGIGPVSQKTELLSRSG